MGKFLMFNYELKQLCNLTKVLIYKNIISLVFTTGFTFEHLNDIKLCACTLLHTIR